MQEELTLRCKQLQIWRTSLHKVIIENPSKRGIQNICLKLNKTNSTKTKSKWWV